MNYCQFLCSVFCGRSLKPLHVCGKKLAQTIRQDMHDLLETGVRRSLNFYRVEADVPIRGKAISDRAFCECGHRVFEVSGDLPYHLALSIFPQAPGYNDHTKILSFQRTWRPS